MPNQMVASSASVIPQQLLALARVMNENTHLAVQLDQIVRLAVGLTGSDHADISLFDPLLKRALPARSNHVFMHQGDDDVAAWIRAKRSHLMVPDVSSIDGDNQFTLLDRDIASYLGVPILIDGEAEGALLIFNRLPTSFGQGQFPTLTALANFASMAIDRHRVKQDLEESSRILLRLSLTDPETGVASWQQFEQLLDREWLRAQDEGLSLALMRVQVQLADRHAADSVPVSVQTLARTARVMQASLYRPGDVIARASGSQFILLLPETDGSGALALARRLRHDVQLLTGEAGGNGQEAWLQIGVACFNGLAMRRGGQFGPQELTARAGQALDKALLQDPHEQLALLQLN